MNKEFLFYSEEGTTFSPTGENVENFQILGRCSADTQYKATEELVRLNPWIIMSGFDIKKIKCLQIIHAE